MRCGIAENVYRGCICCVQVHSNSTYSIAYQAGNIKQLFYLRSALKYVQILPLLESGAVDFYGFTLAEIAVMCASHDAEPIHLETVRSILAKAGLNETDLGCGPHTPLNVNCAFAYIRNGVETPFSSGIYNNCSGKHAGFLALCKYLNLPIKDYLSPTHPLQLLIQEAAMDVFAKRKFDQLIKDALNAAKKRAKELAK